MKIDLIRFYNEIDKIIDSYAYKNFDVKKGKNSFENEYANEIQNCLKTKVQTIKDNYKEIKNEIKKFESELNKLMNYVFINAKLGSQIGYYKNSIDDIKNKIASVDSENEKNLKKLDDLNKALEVGLNGNYCKKNLEIVNILNNKKYKHYYDCIEMCDEFNQFLDVDSIKNNICTKIKNDPAEVERVSNLQLNIEKTKRRTMIINGYKSAYLRLFQNYIDSFRKLCNKKKEINDFVCEIRMELNDSLYNSYSLKTIDILYKSILITSNNNYKDDCIKPYEKKQIIKDWISVLTKGGVRNE